MSAPQSFRYISKNRRVVEDRRFVAGQGNYAGDIRLDGTLHVAMVPSQHPAARRSSSASPSVPSSVPIRSRAFGTRPSP